MSSPRLFFLSALGDFFPGALIILFPRRRRKELFPAAESAAH